MSGLTDSNLMSEADSLTREEKRIDRAAVASIFVSAGLTVAVVGFFIITQADATWQYFGYPALAALPLLIGAGAARWVRRMHVNLLRAHQARLLMRTIELEKMASHDELTDLYNRRFFYERFLEELARVRESRRTLALLTLDIDGLKKINDEYGHAVGDIMIANLAKVMNKHIRTSDVPARLGGDEFAILMPETDKRGAFSLAQRLWAELEEIPMYEHEGIRLLLNVSIGVSGYPWGGEDVDEMMHWADADMYANKVSRRLPEGAAPPAQQRLKDDRFSDPEWM
jgi:diguanylate cyclase (GGDEF)-like protein